MFHFHFGIKINRQPLEPLLNPLGDEEFVHDIVTDGDSFLCWGEPLGNENTTGESIQHYIVRLDTDSPTIAEAVRCDLLRTIEDVISRPLGIEVLLSGPKGLLTTADSWALVVRNGRILDEDSVAA